MSRCTWTVLGNGGRTQLHVAAVLKGDVTRLLAGRPEPLQWVHVVKAPTAEAAALWAITTYEDHRAGRLAGAEVRVEIVAAAGPKTPRALARWRRKRTP